jgi:membrane complex biogenesis BtpA family protein
LIEGDPVTDSAPSNPWPSHSRDDLRGALVGVVHLAPLPGSPGHAAVTFEGQRGMAAVLAQAVTDARVLAAAGYDGVIVENFGDTPFYGASVPPETVAGLALATAAVRDAVGDTPVGVNVLRNDVRAGIGLAATCGAAFVRANVFSGAMVTDQGVLEGHAAEWVRERDRLAPDVRLLADVHVKHAMPLGGGDLVQSARDTFGRGGADGLILSGSGTGAGTDLDELARVREALPNAPLWIGSGLTPDSAAETLALADAAIVGTWIKRDGDVRQPVDPDRALRMVEAVRSAAR